MTLLQIGLKNYWEMIFDFDAYLTEEIARMLAGQNITPEARAAAIALIGN